MTLATLLLFIVASAAIIVTPGPTVLLAMSNGSRHGVRAACWGMGGAVLADLVLIGTVASGLGVVLAASEVAFQFIKWAGAAYLAWLGWKMLRTDAAPIMPSAQADAAHPGGLALGLRSFAVALTNPKALLFMSAFLPQFINPAAPVRPIRHPGRRHGAHEHRSDAGLRRPRRADGARPARHRPALAESHLRRAADRAGGDAGAVSAQRSLRPLRVKIKGQINRFPRLCGQHVQAAAQMGGSVDLQ